jgi:stage II sporulation protein P
MNRFFMHVRHFMVLSSTSLLVFALFAGVALAQTGPSPQANGIAANLPSQLFVDVVRSQLDKPSKTPIVRASSAAKTLFRLITGIEWGDPATLLVEGLPHMGEERTILFHQASGVVVNNQRTPKDYVPPKVAISATAQPATPEPTPTISSKNVVFIYHSHNRESYLPELKNTTNLDSAFSDKVNVTAVGARLGAALRAKGIGAVVSREDYRASEPAFNYINSYRYSLKTIKQAMASNHTLNYFIDIHRDSQRKPYTTVNIKGQNYAQVYFIIGYRNAHWKQNEQFAKQIHQRLERRYPGLSRGVWGKNTGNAEYNQSVSPNSILIEVGGPENTLQECYRTADVLGDVIAEMIWGSAVKES